MTAYTDRNGTEIDLTRTTCDPEICDRLADGPASTALTVELFHEHVIRAGVDHVSPKRVARGDRMGIARILYDHGVMGSAAQNAAEKLVVLPAPDAAREARRDHLLGRIDGTVERPDPAHYEPFQLGLDHLHVAVLDRRTPTARDVAYAWTRLHERELREYCDGVAEGMIAAGR